MQSLFSKAEQHIFENPLTFTSVEPFMVYTRASMSEDRKLWNTLFNTHEEFEQVMQTIQQVAQKRLAKDGVLVMTKVVGGFFGNEIEGKHDEQYDILRKVTALYGRTP